VVASRRDSAGLERGAELLAWLRERREGMTELLAELVEAESPSLDPGAQARAAAIIVRELERLGFAVERLPGQGTGDHLLARRPGAGPESPSQLVLGHLDTVWPVGTLERMPLRASDGLLYGPGAFDMKGGLAQLVFALRALAELGIEPALPVVILVNSDEELGSPDSRRHIERLAREAARAFVLEPAFGTAGRLKTARKGVGRFTLWARGRASHAGLAPEQGASAILEVSHQIQRLFALNDPERGITVNVGRIDGGLRVNVIAPEARAEIEARVVSEADAREVERRIRALEPKVEGVTLEIEGGFDRLPLERTPRNRELWRLALEVAASLGLELGEALVGGASDGNLASAHTATLDGLGAVGDGAHAAYEHVIIDRMPERAALLAGLLATEPGKRGQG